MFVLNNTSIRNLPFTIIYNSITLIIIYFKTFMFKTKTTILQTPKTIIVKFIYTTGK